MSLHRTTHLTIALHWENNNTNIACEWNECLLEVIIERLWVESSEYLREVLATN